MITACPTCDTRIRGYYSVPGVLSLGDAYNPPDFCYACGAPMPWLSRQGRIYQLQNLLDEEGLDPATELRVREFLQELADSDPDNPNEVNWWQGSVRGPGVLGEELGALDRDHAGRGRGETEARPVALRVSGVGFAQWTSARSSPP